MADQLAHLNLRGWRRLPALLPMLLLLVGSWFAVRWCIGNTIAEYMPPDGQSVEAARSAINLAPHDPLAHWRLADVEQSTLPPDKIGEAIQEYQRAVQLSPNDYRLWLPLGRALEQSGDVQAAEQAMRQAVKLAPAYAYPHWYLGNLLLRQGRNDDAFAELRRTGEADPQLRPQVFNLVTEVFGDKLDDARRAVGTNPELQAEYAKYLVERQQYDRAMQVWNGLGAREKVATNETAEVMMQGLIDSKRFRYAMDVWNAIAPPGVTLGQVDRLDDGGFEHIQGSATTGPFGWRWKSNRQAAVALDNGNAHSGSRSLRIEFQSYSKLVLNISQLIVVTPNTQYELNCAFKTLSLESAGTSVVQVIDGNDGNPLGSSPPAPVGNNDWQQVNISFRTGPKTEGILVMIGRAACGGDNPICPIYGSVWYDDFDLKRRS